MGETPAFPLAKTALWRFSQQRDWISRGNLGIPHAQVGKPAQRKCFTVSPYRILFVLGMFQIDIMKSSDEPSEFLIVLPLNIIICQPQINSSDMPLNVNNKYKLFSENSDNSGIWLFSTPESSGRSQLLINFEK